MIFKNIKIEIIGLNINKTIKVLYNEDLHDERQLFYDYNTYIKDKWEGQIFNWNLLIEQITKDLNIKYVSNK